jgi:recombination protein RecA
MSRVASSSSASSSAGGSAVAAGASSSAAKPTVTLNSNNSTTKPGTTSGASAQVEPKPGTAASGATAAAGKPGAPAAAKPAPAAPTPSKEKLQALGQALGQIEKTFGKGSIMRMDEKAYLAVPGISTGALSLDLALGGKGIPRGRIVEIFGPESSGKTTLALTVAAHAQKEGGVAAFIDAEHALDPSWARKIGVNIDDLLVSQPDTGEQALEICELLVRSNAVDLIVVDSVAALIPKAEIEGEMGEAQMGLQARLMSQAMRKLTGVIARSNCTVVFINQIREKIGVMFGSPETTTGGRALKFYSSVRIDVRRIGAIKDGETTIGSRTRARVVKNKIAPPFREAEFDIMYDEGISSAGDLLDLAVADEVVAKSGSWFSYGEMRLGQGREVTKGMLKGNPELSSEIRKKVLQIRLTRPAPAIPVAGNDDEE